MTWRLELSGRSATQLPLCNSSSFSNPCYNAQFEFLSFACHFVLLKKKVAYILYGHLINRKRLWSCKHTYSELLWTIQSLRSCLIFQRSWVLVLVDKATLTDSSSPITELVSIIRQVITIKRLIQTMALEPKHSISTSIHGSSQPITATISSSPCTR